MVVGIQICINNDFEMYVEDFWFSCFWEKFNDECLVYFILDKVVGFLVYGVYIEFDDGVVGDYSVFVGVEVIDEEKVLEEYVIVMLEVGDYLVFQGCGRMFDMVMEIWGQVWYYFESDDVLECVFLIDYEVFEGGDQVIIYVGVK